MCIKLMSEIRVSSWKTTRLSWNRSLSQRQTFITSWKDWCTVTTQFKHVCRKEGYRPPVNSNSHVHFLFKQIILLKILIFYWKIGNQSMTLMLNWINNYKGEVRPSLFMITLITKPACLLKTGAGLNNVVKKKRAWTVFCAPFLG